MVTRNPKQESIEPPKTTIDIEISKLSKITISTFIGPSGGRYLNIRKFWRTQVNYDWLPAKQGITIPEELAEEFLTAFAFELKHIGDAPALEKSEEDALSKTKKRK